MTTGSVTPTCGTCRHWLLETERSQIGTCKRFPPTVFLSGQALPHTAAADWCGEHEAPVEDSAKPVGFAPPAPKAAAREFAPSLPPKPKRQR